MHISDGVLHPAVLAGGFAAAGALGAWGLREIRDSDYPRVGILTAGFFAASLIHIKLPPTSVHLTLNSLLGIALGARCFPAITVALFLQAALLGHGGLTVVGVNAVMMAVPGFAAGTIMRRGLKAASPGWVPFIVTVLVLSFATPKMLSAALAESGLLAGSLSFPIAAAIGVLIAALLLTLERLARGGAVFRWGFSAGALAVFGAALILFCILAFAPLARHMQREAFREIAYFAFLSHVPIMLVEGIIVAFVVRYVKIVAPDVLQLRLSQREG